MTGLFKPRVTVTSHVTLNGTPLSGFDTEEYEQLMNFSVYGHSSEDVELELAIALYYTLYTRVQLCYSKTTISDHSII